ncbi:Homeobox protein Hox-A3a [Thelohanellus kitauei]|uniref:Homeobox protein Hox-A3a n=1 Tax=Thelohanellus kitauei TaxID=669202 RepID=A0A0C2N8W4_THEKT|nr:Homeobox protein Hox-A3a [Thelohanellus kitauei]
MDQNQQGSLPHPQTSFVGSYQSPFIQPHPFSSINPSLREHAFIQTGDRELSIEGQVLNTSQQSSTSITTESVTKPRRKPTVYTERQLEILENEFKMNHFIGREKRVQLANSFNIHEKHIKFWFQNRRMKHKKDLKLVEEKESIQTYD